MRRYADQKDPWAMLDQIGRTLGALEMEAWKAGQLAEEQQDEEVFARAEIVRTALSIAYDLTNSRHKYVRDTAAHLLNLVNEFYSFASR